MQTLVRVAILTALLSVLHAVPGVAPALADATVDDGVVVTVDTLGATPEPDYPVLTRGQVLLINAQRFVVTQEPPPTATVAEAPPEPLNTELDRPAAPNANAIWVDPHWAYGSTGFSWVAGRYVAPRAGHVFVPPRWASVNGAYLYFSGFYVPRGVYVRSHFNRYYYSGVPAGQAASNSGPYWPIGAPSPAHGHLTRANANDPYWPIGAPR